MTEGDYTDCKDADIVVITAGPPPKQGQSRLDTLGLSADIISTIVEPVMKSGFNGIFLVVTNPVDSITHYVYQLSGLPKQQVLGTGTAIDSARLKHYIGDILHVDPRSIQAYTMGEHGDSQMCPWSLVTVGGKSIMEIIRDNKEFSGIDFNEILYKVIRVGFDILSVKGTTCYGIASAAVGIIKAILYDENSILPVSTLLEGEYGEFHVYAGVPCILNRFGVKDVVEVNMTEAELDRFQASVRVVRGAIENLKDRDKKALSL